MAGYLTTHVLDTALGCPAEGLKIKLFELSDNERRELAAMETNSDGRTNSPILPQHAFRTGVFELVFDVEDYFLLKGHTTEDPMFLHQIPIRFGMSDAEAHYHVPLLLSPYGYSTYRGS